MKILIIAFHPRYMTPYCKLYEDFLQSNNIDYDILFWDRFSNATLEKKKNEFTIHRICSLGGSKLKKIIPMWNFRITLNKIIQANNYDKIIVLNTLPAVLLNDTLLKKYKEKFILDIRDYTYEKYCIYKNKVNELIGNSYITTISSRGFMRFLKNSEKIYINHNISNDEDILNHKTEDIRYKEILKIGFAGVIRYEDENKFLIDSLKDSRRYKLQYIGREYPGINLKKYIEDNVIRNVTFKGKFENKDKPQIYQDIDIINAYYGTGTLEVDTALPNKLYDCLIFKKPMIATKGTYLSTIVEKYNLGIAISKDDDLKTKLDNFIKNFNAVEFEKTTNMLLKIVANDQEKIVEKLKEFIK